MKWWMRQKVHSSWGIALVCAAFVLGVAVSLYIHVPWGIGLIALGLLPFIFWYRFKFLLSVLILTGMAIGCGYGSAHLGDRATFNDYRGQTVQVVGKIREDPSKSKSGSYSLQLDTVRINGFSLPGAIYASVKNIEDAKRGDYVTITGEVRDGFGNFPISVSALRLDAIERPVPGDVGRIVRDWFADQVRTHIKEPEASLGIGFLTGQKSALPEDLSEALKVAGLTHIVVASGYNLTILVRLARRLFVNISKYLSAVSSTVMILLFMAITGLSPSMTRAGLVSGLSLMAWYYGHKLHPFILLPFAAAITVVINAAYVWGDLGWQLSFVAFAGVMIVAPLLQSYFYGAKEPGILRQILGETIAAHIVTIPVIALSFGTISHVAIIANVLVVPLVPLAMLLTFISGVLSIIQLPFAFLVAEPTSWLLSYMINVATFVSELSWAQSELSLQPLIWVGYGLVVIGLCFWMWRATRYDFRGANPIL